MQVRAFKRYIPLSYWYNEGSFFSIYIIQVSFQSALRLMPFLHLVSATRSDLNKPAHARIQKVLPEGVQLRKFSFSFFLFIF